ncbi:hypothetical protein JB92DRAFT_2834911 [Gautieria morchelliformis]|nr:hypothetical protein JB92DRAFT_2834911 [Gautieria morchelliformis]
MSSQQAKTDASSCKAGSQDLEASLSALSRRYWAADRVTEHQAVEAQVTNGLLVSIKCVNFRVLAFSELFNGPEVIHKSVEWVTDSGKKFSWTSDVTALLDETLKVERLGLACIFLIVYRLGTLNETTGSGTF